MAVRKVKGTWWVDFMYNRERFRKRSPLNTKAGAEAFEAHVRRLVAQHGSVSGAHAAMMPVRERAITFAEFSERWLRDYVDVNNKPSERYYKRKILQRTLLPAFGKRRLDEISADHIERYKRTELDRGLSNKSINNALTILRKCLVTAVDWDVLKHVPRFRFLRLPPPETRVVTPDDSARLLAACPPTPWRALVLTALRTGLRFNELIALEWSDVDLPNAILTVRRGEWRGHVGLPKTYETRVIPLTSEVIEALRSLPRSHPRVFTNRGRTITYSCAWENLTKICRHAKVPHTSWHTLRHTFATNLNGAHGNIKHIQELLGHKTLTMTLRYTHPVTEALRQTISLLEPGQRAPRIGSPLSTAGSPASLASSQPPLTAA